MHLQAARDAGSGDVTIAWVRQTRIGGDPWEPVDVPLGEASEAYRVEILDGATAVRSVDRAAPSLSYPAAEQAADFGTPPASIGVRVRQISASEGPGIAAEAVLAV